MIREVQSTAGECTQLAIHGENEKTNVRTRRVKKSMAKMAYKYGCSNNSASFIAQQYEIDVLISAFFIILYRVGSFISELTDRISCDFLHISYDRVGKWLDLSEK